MGMNFRTKRYGYDSAVFNWNTILIVFMITSHSMKATKMKTIPQDSWESTVLKQDSTLL